MQRLYSTFPCGLPGAGLVLLRVVVAVPLIHAGLLTVLSSAPRSVDIVTAIAALLLLAGLWTPVAGGLLCVVELGLAVWHPDDPWKFVQVAVLGGALAMLGPGGCSVDARLFGRKQIEIPQR